LKTFTTNPLIVVYAVISATKIKTKQKYLPVPEDNVTKPLHL